MQELFTRKRFVTPFTEQQIAADWATRGYSCQLFVDPPGQRWEDFMHDCNELVTVQQGRLEMEIDGKVLEMGPGDELFIPKGAVHSVRNIHAGISKWLYGYD